ncbi:PilT/PilU family type 4a pilus ATPase [candidate division KSB1 bacterium]|nr:PilT/PilU family type 4a pilus ATPase [candidate division KSB1 bacterium]
MPINPKILQVGKQLLSQLAAKIPATVFGIEKQKYIGFDIVGTLSNDHKLILIKFMNSILLRMREVEASDVDLGGWASKSAVWFRIHGDKKPFKEFGAFTIDECSILIQSLVMESQRTELYENRNLDFSYSFDVGNNGTVARYRADAYLDLDSLALNMRAINTQIRPYEGFGFDNHVTRIVSLAHTKEGLILVTGITGSGKSTTLDAIVDLNNRTVDAHIIIIASPVEFVHESKRCIIRHREVGRDTQSFKKGTIEALRQDPDIIIIGEMRDPDTIISALEVVDSGHKVLSTLHTSSAVESVDRIIAEVPPVEQERVRSRLSDVLRCVISQKLVPTRDGRRVLAKEVMVVTPSVRAAIKNNNINEIYQMISEGSKVGMNTMEQDLKRLYLERKIAIETAFSYANNKRRMQQLIQPM